MGDESNAFYVLRKGDIIGIYKSLDDCQAQVSSSVCDPSVSVYKGYSLSKDAEEYLASRGLKSAIYTINSLDLKEDLFGALLPCPFQQPDRGATSASKASNKISSQKRQQEVKFEGNLGDFEFKADQSRKQVRLGDVESRTSYNSLTCVLQFDGASKGNPGKSGAGAVLRTEDGRVVWRLREGLGITTNNVAEYRALILGLKYALEQGYKRIRVLGDSNLVCMQVQDKWQTKNKNMADLCKVAKELKDKFLSFDISHIARELNSDADAQANMAINLEVGEVQMDYDG